MLTRALPVCLLAAVLAGCGSDQSAPAAPSPTASRSISVSSPAFADGAAIPATYTCRGSGTSPALQWSGVPDGTRALALVVDDPDAPHGTYTHWVVADIPPTVSAAPAGRAPLGGAELKASGGKGWSPPCPPSGTHHYRFSVYALSAPLHLPGDTSLADAMTAIADRTLAWGRLTGTVTAGSSGGGY